MLKRFKIVGLCLVAVFAVSAVASASASAQVWEWRVCEKVEKGTGEFEKNTCEGAAGTKEFKWSPWSEYKVAEPVTSSGTLELTDKGTGVTVTCTGTNKGTVGPGNKDEITEIVATSCKSSNTLLCSEPVTATAVGLPWVTTLEGSPVRDKITSKNGTVVGWLVKCNNGQTDECTAASSSTAMTNNANGTVTATFDASTPKANCTKGGSGKGEVKGTSIDKGAAGTQVRVS